MKPLKTCTTCKGRKNFKCKKCNGNGKIKKRNVEMICPSCSGAGHYVCKTCHGSGMMDA